MRTRTKVVWGIVTGVVLLVIACIGVPLAWFASTVYEKVEARKAALAAMSGPTLPAPTERCVVTQRFGFEDGTSAHFGHGFFTRTRTGAIVGVTAIHFLELSGPPLTLVEWFAGDESQPLGAATRTFATPGRQPDYLFSNCSTDFLLLTPETPIKGAAPLELDDRVAGPDLAEPVWFAAYNPADLAVTRWVRGAVTKRSEKVINILLAETDIVFEGTSGSPVISGKTGQVIGLVTAATVGPRRIEVMLCPIHAVRRAMIDNDSASSSKKLAQVDWRAHAAP